MWNLLLVTCNQRSVTLWMKTFQLKPCVYLRVIHHEWHRWPKLCFKKKAKAKCRSPDGCPINLKERINAIVRENRKSLASGKMGSKAWWKKVDALSKRKERSNPSFDEDSVRELNHYFANLCHDEDYIRPVPMDITENIPAPQLTLSQVYYALLKTKQTSTGPDNIPFWVWKENAAILAPAVQAIWNLSLSTQRWPSA